MGITLHKNRKETVMNVFTLTFAVLLVLKLTEVIAVSYWVVCAPLILAPVGFLIGLLMLAWANS